PKSQQHADQRGHRHGEHKHSRKDADKERQNLHAGTAVAHKQLHQPDQLRHEKDKSEDDKSEECVAENFADDIPVQDAHDANGECNTVATAFGLSPPRPFFYRLMKKPKLTPEEDSAFHSGVFSVLSTSGRNSLLPISFSAH